jgi:hypothetical protein
MIVGSLTGGAISHRLALCETVDTGVDGLAHSRYATKPRSETTGAGSNGNLESSFSRGQQLRDVF